MNEAPNVGSGRPHSTAREGGFLRQNLGHFGIIDQQVQSCNLSCSFCFTDAIAPPTFFPSWGWTFPRAWQTMPRISWGGLRHGGGTPYTTDFDGADGGKQAHYMLRWVNTRGETGPWSETATAMIGA
jgi:hypothetical protein